MEEIQGVFLDDSWLSIALLYLIYVLICYPVLEIFVLHWNHILINPFYEIQKLFPSLRFITMRPHLVVGIIIDTKHI